MKKAVATLRSFSPYSQSSYKETRKEAKESDSDHEARTWRERMHVTEDGHVFIPPMAFKNCLSEVAKYLSIKIPDKGKATYTKHFEAGVMVKEALILPVRADDVKGEWLFVPSNGQRGGSRRVKKCFPLIPEWSGDVEFYILDDTITKSVFEQHLGEAGLFIGIGRFRPRNNGFYGRFTVSKIEWEEINI